MNAGAEKLKRLVEQSEAAGHLILPKKLGGIGFDMSGLAKSLGETPAQLKADLAAGKIEVDKGIAAIDQALGTQPLDLHALAGLCAAGRRLSPQAAVWLETITSVLDKRRLQSLAL